MFDDVTFDRLAERVGPVLLAWIAAKLPEAKQWPRWMSVETAGEYMDKTYQGMRYTVTKYKNEFPMYLFTA